jgi:uncharacterized protein YjbI with pentapeptide repeats
MSEAACTIHDDGTAAKTESGLREADAALVELLQSRPLPSDDVDELELLGVDFSGLNLQGANFAKARIEECVFDRADLTLALFTDAVIESTTFVGATLKGAALGGAELLWVDFTAANLEGIDFRPANLEEVVINRANLENTAFDTPCVTFLDASNVKGMDLSDLADEDLEPKIRLSLHELGARAHGGHRCPRCLQWDGADYGLDPTCSLCGAVGFVDFDPESRRAELPLACPWCSGTGGQSYSMSSAGCLVCDGLGKVQTWVIDRNQFRDNVSGDYFEYESETEFPSMALGDIDFSEDWFEDGHIEDVVFTRCSFERANFAGALIKDVRFVDCNLSDATLARASLTEVVFFGCQFERSDWTDASFDVVGADPGVFTGATIQESLLATLVPLD